MYRTIGTNATTKFRPVSHTLTCRLSGTFAGVCIERMLIRKLSRFLPDQGNRSRI